MGVVTDEVVAAVSGGSGGLSFLQRLDTTGRRSVGNSTDIGAVKHSPSSHSSRNKKEQQVHAAAPAPVVGSGGGGKEREKGGLGRGMRISEEDMDEVGHCESHSEEKEMGEEEM